MKFTHQYSGWHGDIHAIDTDSLPLIKYVYQHMFV